LPHVLQKLREKGFRRDRPIELEVARFHLLEQLVLLVSAQVLEALARLGLYDIGLDLGDRATVELGGCVTALIALALGRIAAPGASEIVMIALPIRTGELVVEEAENAPLRRARPSLVLGDQTVDGGGDEIGFGGGEELALTGTGRIGS